MDRYQETFATWNNVAQLYQDKFMDIPLYHESYDFICENVAKPNAVILEIGCGPGNITQYLLARRPDFHIHGIDIAPKMIELAAKNNPTARFTVMDARKVGELNMDADAIVCGFCLPYLSEDDARQLIESARSILPPQGLFYISFLEGDPRLSGFQTGSSGDRTYFYYHTLERIEQNLRINGFHSLKIFKVLYPRTETTQEVHTLLIAQKHAD